MFLNKGNDDKFMAYLMKIDYIKNYLQILIEFDQIYYLINIYQKISKYQI
jgi:hypothetical protein